MGKGTNWMHAAIGEFDHSMTPKLQSETTACGKTARRIMATHSYHLVTCQRCIDVIKTTSWYCQYHGFISDKWVTNDERCQECGNNVGDIDSINDLKSDGLNVSTEELLNAISDNGKTTDLYINTLRNAKKHFRYDEMTDSEQSVFWQQINIVIGKLVYF